MTSPLPRRTFLGLAIGGLVVAACGNDDTNDATTATTAAAGAGNAESGGDEQSIQVVPPTTAAGIIDADDPRLFVLDVRTPEEFAEAHIEDAQLIDIYEDDFEERIAALDRDAQYVLYCRSGNRSSQARLLMERLGFTEVYDVDGGIASWIAAGLPVVTS